jgi:hypothetical protein
LVFSVVVTAGGIWLLLVSEGLGSAGGVAICSGAGRASGVGADSARGSILPRIVAQADHCIIEAANDSAIIAVG